MTPFDCPNCEGKGEVVYSAAPNENPCPLCGGSGIDPELRDFL